MNRIGRGAMAALGVLIGGSAARADVGLWFIPPQATDPRISIALQSHIAGSDPDLVPRNMLYLHLVGSCGNPSHNVDIVRHAAGLGFHVVSLSYPNCPSVETLVGDSTSTTVHEEIRLERLTGTDASSLLRVGVPDSIDNRAQKLLEYLMAEDPDGGWDRYLSPGGVRWGSIIVGGHSQGAGHAAFIAKRRVVAGAIMLGGPGDGYANGGGLAPWIIEPGVTPASRAFGFTHLRDVVIVRAAPAYQAMGMAALGAANVDALAPPYGGAHVLTSNAEPGTPGEFHGCVVVDAHLARHANGTPVYAPVWTYLLEAARAGACAADMDDGSGAGVLDGAVTIEDLVYFLSRFELGDPGVDIDDGSQTGRPDEGVDISDLVYFLARFEAGC